MNNERIEAVYNMLMDLSMAETYSRPEVKANEQTMNIIMALHNIDKRELIMQLAIFIPDAFGGLNESAGNWAKKLFDVAVKTGAYK